MRKCMNAERQKCIDAEMYKCTNAEIIQIMVMATI